MIELSEKALGICKDNYKTNCGGCSLRSQCCRSVGPGKEASDRWITEVNEAAEMIRKPQVETVLEGQLTLF